MTHLLTKAMSLPAKSSLYVGKIDWSNTVDSFVFNMLIARLFSDSWSGNSKKQNFKLIGYHGTMVKLIGKTMCQPGMAMAFGLSGLSPLNVFNSTSVCSFLASKMIDS